MAIRFYDLLRSAINIFLGIISFFLLFRILFLLFSANQATPLVAWVLNVSSFFMTPFAGILPDIRVSGGILDMVAVVTLLAYLLLGYLVLSLIQNLVDQEIAVREEEHSASMHYHEIERPEGFPRRRRVRP